MEVLWLVGVAVVLAGADQLAKRGVTCRLALGERRAVVRGVELAHVRNARGGLVALPTPVAVVVATGCTVAAVVAVAGTGTGVAIGLGLAVGGAVSNVIDRVRLGAVVDIVALARWRVVNLADVALVVGAVVVGASVLVAAT